MSGGHFFSPWESPRSSERIPQGCGRSSGIADGDSNASNPTRRGRVGGEGSTEPNLCFRPFSGENANESPTGHQKIGNSFWSFRFFNGLMGTRMAQATFSCCCAAIHLEGGTGEVGVKKCPGDTFLARGRVPGVPNASRRGAGGAPAFPEKSKIAERVVVGADPYISFLKHGLLYCHCKLPVAGI